MKKLELLRLSRLREQTVSGEARQIREDAKVSQSEIARVVGVPPSTISLWEGAKRVPQGDKALRYAEVLDGLASAAVKT